MEQPVQNLMKTTMENIKNMIDVNTIIGDAVETKDGSVIVPVSKVSFAFVAGGGALGSQKQHEIEKDRENAVYSTPFAGGSGAGVTVQPIGFLATNNGQLKMIPVNYNTALDRIIDMVPGFLENMDSLMNKKSKDKDFVDEERV